MSTSLELPTEMLAWYKYVKGLKPQQKAPLLHSCYLTAGRTHPATWLLLHTFVCSSHTHRFFWVSIPAYFTPFSIPPPPPSPLPPSHSSTLFPSPPLPTHREAASLSCHPTECRVSAEVVLHRAHWPPHQPSGCHPTVLRPQTFLLGACLYGPAAVHRGGVPGEPHHYSCRDQRYVPIVHNIHWKALGDTQLPSFLTLLWLEECVECNLWMLRCVRKNIQDRLELSFLKISGMDWIPLAW